MKRTFLSLVLVAMTSQAFGEPKIDSKVEEVKRLEPVTLLLWREYLFRYRDNLKAEPLLVERETGPQRSGFNYLIKRESGQNLNLSIPENPK